MLRAGLWIAQGPETNVLLLLQGVEPMLEVNGGIDLNYFKATGKARELTKDSLEVVDIMMYPEKYTFSEPSVTDAINSIGIGNTQELEGLEDKKLKDEMIKDGTAYYKSALTMYVESGQNRYEQAKVRTRLYLRNKYNLKMSQANWLYTVICKVLNRAE